MRLRRRRFTFFELPVFKRPSHNAAEGSQPRLGPKAVTWLQQWSVTSSVGACLETVMIWISTWAVFNSFQQRKISKGIARYVFTTLCAQFSIWKARLEAVPHSTLSTVPIHVAVLETHRTLLQVLLQVTFKSFDKAWDETCWDTFEPEYIRALSIIESRLGRTTETVTQNDQSCVPAKVEYTPSLYNSLNIIAKACRHPQIRRRAAAALQSSLRSGLSTLPLKSRDSLTKHSAIYFLIDEVILLEEVA